MLANGSQKAPCALHAYGKGSAATKAGAPLGISSLATCTRLTPASSRPVRCNARGREGFERLRPNRSAEFCWFCTVVRCSRTEAPRPPAAGVLSLDVDKTPTPNRPIPMTGNDLLQFAKWVLSRKTFFTARTKPRASARLPGARLLRLSRRSNSLQSSIPHVGLRNPVAR